MNKEDKEYEIRSYGANAAPKVPDPESRVIDGYAIVFNQRSNVLWDKANQRYFVEIISPAAVNESLLRSNDIKATLEHDRSRMLARSFNGSGTLNLSIDDIGVKYRFESPNTEDGNYALEMVKRGDLFGSSFMYMPDPKGVEYKMENGVLLRNVSLIKKILDVSIVSDPAYMGTSVEVRSLESFYDNPIDKDKEEKEKIKNQLQELRRLQRK